MKLRTHLLRAAAALLIAIVTGNASAAANAGQAAAQPQTAAPARTSAIDANLPPLIDRELFFGNPEIATGTISPDGRHIAFRKPWNGTMNIWVKGVAEPFAAAKRITAEAKRPIPAF